MLKGLIVVALVGAPFPSAAVVRSPCPEPSATGACAIAAAAKVYAPAGTSRFAVEHELGHMYDRQFLDTGERNAMKRAMGMSVDRTWKLGTGLTASGLGSPSERFADLYAACRLRLDPERRWESAYDYQPTRREFWRACGVLSRAGWDQGDGTTR